MSEFQTGEMYGECENCGSEGDLDAVADMLYVCEECFYEIAAHESD